MGSGTHYTANNVRLSKPQISHGNTVKPTSQHGDWYAKIDPKTGSITWLRRKVKKRK